MKAAVLGRPHQSEPAAALNLVELPEREATDGLTIVELRAGALNMHDVWMLRGFASASGPGPHVLGSDGAGVADGRDVVVYPVLPPADRGPVVGHATLLSDRGYGLLAEQQVVPAANLFPKPAHLSWVEAASLPTSWLTAYRMLFTHGSLEAGQAVLVQGAGGGVATAAVGLAAAVGAHVVVTSRSAEKRERALAFGATEALEPGERLAELADVVVETVGPATFDHSLRSVRPGGAVVCCGSATGFTAEVNLARLFAKEIRLHGSTTGTAEEFGALLDLVDRAQIRPVVDSVVPLPDVRSQIERMVAGTGYGKLCVDLA